MKGMQIFIVIRTTQKNEIQRIDIAKKRFIEGSIRYENSFQRGI